MLTFVREHREPTDPELIELYKDVIAERGMELYGLPAAPGDLPAFRAEWDKWKVVPEGDVASVAEVGADPDEGGMAALAVQRRRWHDFCKHIGRLFGKHRKRP